MRALKNLSQESLRTVLMLGDLIIYFFVALLGLAAHGTLLPFSWGKLLPNFLPFAMAWLLLAPWIGLFRKTIVLNRGDLWRPGLVAMLATPLGAVSRSWWLETPIIPTFVLVIGLVSMVALTLWRTSINFLLRIDGTA